MALLWARAFALVFAFSTACATSSILQANEELETGTPYLTEIDNTGNYFVKTEISCPCVARMCIDGKCISTGKLSRIAHGAPGLSSWSPYVIKRREQDAKYADALLENELQLLWRLEKMLSSFANEIEFEDMVGPDAEESWPPYASEQSQNNFVGHYENARSRVSSIDQNDIKMLGQNENDVSAYSTDDGEFNQLEQKLPYSPETEDDNVVEQSEEPWSPFTAEQDGDNILGQNIGIRSPYSSVEEMERVRVGQSGEYPPVLPVSNGEHAQLEIEKRNQVRNTLRFYVVSL